MEKILVPHLFIWFVFVEVAFDKKIGINSFKHIISMISYHCPLQICDPDFFKSFISFY